MDQIEYMPEHDPTLTNISLEQYIQRRIFARTVAKDALQQLTMNDYGRLNNVKGMVFNTGSLSYAKGLAQATESIIGDVWQCIKLYDEKRLPLPPTVAFKCRSLVSFAANAELMAMVLPKMIRVSIPKVLEQSKYDEYYCVCGCVSAHE